MMRAAIQLSKNPNKRLLTDLTKSPITSKIERLLKGPKFSLAHPGSPSKAPSPFKRQKLNLNSTPSDRMTQGGRGRGSPGGRGASPARGGQAYRGRGGGRNASRNPTDGAQTPGRTLSLWGGTAGMMNGRPVTGPGAVSTPEIESETAGNNDTLSPLKGRVLLWDEDI